MNVLCRYVVITFRPILLQENSPDTFWVWFDGILVMVKMYLEDLWRDGYVFST